MKRLKIAIFEPRLNELQRIDGLLQNSPFFFETFLANKVELATDLMKSHEHFHLIIVNQMMSPYKKVNQHFIQQVLAKYVESKFIFLYRSNPQQSTMTSIIEDQLGYNPWIEVPVSPIKIMSLISDIFPKMSEKPRESKEYAKIRYDVLLRCGMIPCEVFIRLSSGKMVKLQNENDKLNMDRFEKYIEKGINHFFIKRECYMKRFDSFYPKNLVSRKLFKTDDEYVVKAHESLHGLIGDFGVSEDTLETVGALAEETMEALKDNKLAHILSLLENSEDSFIYDHSYLVSLICMESAKKFEWYSKKHDKIITMASLLHDTGFQSPKLGAIELLSEDKMNELDPEVLKLYKDHPRVIADQLKDIHQVPSDVLGIVYKHHEGFGPGISFPRGFRSTQLSAIECLFVMSHEVVILFYKKLFHKDKIEEALIPFYEKFNTGYFRKYLANFKSAVSDMIKTM